MLDALRGRAIALRSADISKSLIDWAREQFQQEVRTGFARARVFDGPFAQICLEALNAFSPEQLQMLKKILPSYGRVPELQNTMTVEEKKLVDALNDARQHIFRTRLNERMAQVSPLLRRPLSEFKSILRVARETFAGFAKQWGYDIRKAEPAVWLLSRSEKWGTVVIVFDLHEKISMSYNISIKSDQFIEIDQVSELPKRDHYLGRLGVGMSSDCFMVDADSCAEKFRQVGEIAHWHADAYIRIIDSLTKSVEGASPNANTGT